MNVSCPDCRSIFRVDPAKVPPAGVRARCSVCSGVISIPAPTGQNTPPSGTVTSRPSVESSSSTPQAPQVAQTGWDTGAFAQTGERALSSTTPRRPAQPSPTPARSETPPAARPRHEAPDQPTAAATATPRSPASALPEFTPPPPIPPFRPTGSPPPMPTPQAASVSSPASAPFVPSAGRSPVATPPSSNPSGPTRPASQDSGARRPLNPFLSKDPNQRAKRLARALVSDIITYHPAKHAEGLRDGTLKQLFREEIKKSFEEYIAQVGQQLAESTTYFQEALNEVLGAGKKIF